jgi:hypothetical protein
LNLLVLTRRADDFLAASNKRQIKSSRGLL